MRVVSLPFQAWIDDLGEIPGVSLVPWDFTTPPPEEHLDMVVIGFPPTGDPFGRLPEVKGLDVLQLTSAGYDYVGDRLPAGARLANGRGIHSTATSELALALILAAQRDIPAMVRSQDRGRWEWPEMRAGLADQRVLIVGYGDIGQALGRRLAACEAAVTGAARSARPGDGVADRVVPMAEVPGIIGEFAIVVALTPLTDDTRGLFDADLIGRMRPGALLVNMARGPIVDTEALMAACREGRIRAALDVTDPEPLPDGHPLFSTPGVLIAPHMGGQSDAARPRAVAMLREQLTRYGAGDELINIVR